MRKKVYIAVLNQTEICTPLHHLLQNISFQNKYELFIEYPTLKPIAYNRNHTVQNFLARKEFEYLIMIDSDINPPLNILNLVDYELDIVAPFMFMQQDNQITPLCLERKLDGLYTVALYRGDEGLFECDAVGTGCIVLSRKVLEDPNMKAPFMNEYDADGIKLWGLDIAFCRRAKEVGYKVYCHLDYPCEHYSKVNLKQMYTGLFNLANMTIPKEQRVDVVFTPLGRKFLTKNQVEELNKAKA